MRAKQGKEKAASSSRKPGGYIHFWFYKNIKKWHILGGKDFPKHKFYQNHGVICVKAIRFSMPCNVSGSNWTKIGWAFYKTGAGLWLSIYKTRHPSDPSTVTSSRWWCKEYKSHACLSTASMFCRSEFVYSEICEQNRSAIQKMLSSAVWLWQNNDQFSRQVDKPSLLASCIHSLQGFIHTWY